MKWKNSYCLTPISAHAAVVMIVTAAFLFYLSSIDESVAVAGTPDSALAVAPSATFIE